jgi:hypothetical protein
MSHTSTGLNAYVRRELPHFIFLAIFHDLILPFTNDPEKGMSATYCH